MTALLQEGEILLRPPEPSDLDMLYRWENDASLWNVGDMSAPLSRHMLHRYIENYTGDIYADRQIRLMICRGAEPVGTLDLYDYSPRYHRAGVGIMVVPEHRRQGVASTALDIVGRYASGQLGIEQLWCLVAADNAPSLALFALAGYERCALLHRWLGERDAVMLQWFCAQRDI